MEEAVTQMLDLTGYKACICEGSAEAAVMDILLDNDLLIFNRSELLEESVIRSRSAKKFEERYLRKSFNEKISIIRILDSRREQFKISKEYLHKINVINIITAPEIEMLMIYSEGTYEKFKRSRKKPSEFCKENLKMKNIKQYNFVRDYFSDPVLLVDSIMEYRRTANIPNGEFCLADILK